MTRRRQGLAVLMRARMRAAASTANTTVQISLQPAAVDTPPPSSLSDPKIGGDHIRGARGSDALIHAKALMRESVCTTSKSSATEVTEKNLRDFIKVYAEMNSQGRWELLSVLAEEYYVDRRRLRYLMQQYMALNRPSSDDGGDGFQPDIKGDCPSLSVFFRIERNMMEILKPKYATFFEQLNEQIGGLKLLVNLRADLLCMLREHNLASLRALDFFLKEKLVTGLSPATLVLQQITWNDPASLLEKIVAYEAVHPIRNILDLKRRLGIGRRCFGYLHPSIPGEPLIFIEVALLGNIARSIQEVLLESFPVPEHEAACALFYSISSTQHGLSGINLGRFLIKRVVELLKKDMPHISIFATLSPVPGYMQWLHSKLIFHSKLSVSEFGNRLNDGSSSFIDHILTSDEEMEIINACPNDISGRNGMEVLQKILASPAKEWTKNDQLLAVLRHPLLRLCARYLLNEKKRGRALDAVANFHLQNGAMIERINWMADLSEKGLQESCGIMVNYVYRLDKIEENANAYSTSGDISASSSTLY